MPPLATRLINQYGTTITYNQTSDGAYDVTTSKTINVVTPYTIKGVVEEYADSIRFLGSKMEATGIIQGDKKLTISGQNVFTPAVGDSVIVGSDGGFNVIDVASQRSGELIAIWVLHLRSM
jgi:hypothetical protein